MTDGDGRNIDPRLGLLGGEAADQGVPGDRAGSRGGPPSAVWPEIPSRGPEDRADPTYYDRPVIKRPVWKWYVPAYFFAGGAAGGAAVLGAAAQVADRRGLDRLVRRCRWLAAVGGGVGTALLIADLGRPERFLNMLRVFRPTSPMNVGSWVLAGLGPSAAVSALLSRPGGPFGFLGDVAGLASGAAGVPLSGYTAVLLANTAVPVWQETRRTSPALFVSSAAGAAASLLQLMPMTEREERVVRRFALAAGVADLASEAAAEREAGVVERVARPLHEGRSGALLRASKLLTASWVGLNLVPGRRPWLRRSAGVLGTMAALATKFGFVEAGTASAADPRATFHQQRAGLGGAAATGRPSVTSSERP